MSQAPVSGPSPAGAPRGPKPAPSLPADADRAEPPAPRPFWLLRGAMATATIVVRTMGRSRYWVADALGTLAWLVARRRRRVARAEHLRLDPTLRAWDLRRRARGSFCEFSRTAVDFLWANGMDPEVVVRHAVVGGQNITDRATARGRGGVLALTHFGNWDMAAVIAHAIGLRLTTVMAATGPRAITELVVWARGRNHLEVFEAHRAAFGLLRALRRNRFVAIISDLPESGPTVVVDYCGGPVRFSAVPAWLAMRTGALLIPTACWREAGRYHIAALEAIEANAADDEASLMQRVARTIEPLVRRHPTQWYPFRPVHLDLCGPGSGQGQGGC